MYRRPTEEEIRFAVDCGWSYADAERGYTIFEFDVTGILEVCRIDDVYGDADVYDEDCAHQAELDGFCKIIPVDELPPVMMYEDYDRRYFGWVDTPENRKSIAEFFKQDEEPGHGEVGYRITLKTEFWDREDGSMPDYESMAASLYDGGWRYDDHDELIREHGLTEEEADKICDLLAEYEEQED